MQKLEFYFDKLGCSDVLSKSKNHSFFWPDCTKLYDRDRKNVKKYNHLKIKTYGAPSQVASTLLRIFSKNQMSRKTVLANALRKGGQYDKGYGNKQHLKVNA